MTWWKRAVVYQIYPRSFADADGDGVGDLEGIARHLDHLVALGVDVVWLSPVYPSPQEDNGYDVSDYRDIDPMFGSLETFDRLLAALHERGIRLVMDLVVNHSSDEHPWFVESRSSRESAKRDWYWWRPAREGRTPGEPGAEPNNWGSFFSGPAWTFDEATGEYYLHLFAPKQPDLNWEHDAVREAVYSMMRWWLDRGVDGFRMDVVNFLSKDPSLPDGEVGDGSRYGQAMPSINCGPRIHAFVQEMHREVFAGRDGLLTVGEMPGVTVDEAVRFTDPARSELDMVFQFEHVQLEHGVARWRRRGTAWGELKAVLGRWQSGLAEVGWNSLYFSNHDQPRSVSRFGDDRPEHRVRSAKTLGTLLHLQRGTPYVYQGEELGMTNAPFGSVQDLRDIESLNHVAEASAAGEDVARVLADIRAWGRDNARTPMQWDASADGGFTTGRPWLAVNPNHVEINAEAARADPDSVFHHYRRLIELRHADQVVVDGDFRMLLEDDERVFAFERRLGDEALLVLANVTSEPARIEVPDAEAWAEGELVLANVGRVPSLGSDAPLELGPWESRVYRRGGSRR